MKKKNNTQDVLKDILNKLMDERAKHSFLFEREQSPEGRYRLLGSQEEVAYIAEYVGKLYEQYSKN